MKRVLIKVGVTIVLGVLLHFLIGAFWVFLGCDLFIKSLPPQSFSPDELIGFYAMMGAWPVLLICFIICGGLIWIPVFHRFQRVKRGLCPACAYPVGTSPVCTECGKPVKQKAETQKAETA